MTSRLHFKFTGEEGSCMSLRAALTATAVFQGLYPTRRSSYFIGTQALQVLLDTPSVVGIRVYFGLSKTGAEQLVLTATDAFANDLLNGPVLATFPWMHDSVFPTWEDRQLRNGIMELGTYVTNVAAALALTRNFQHHNCGQTCGVFWGCQRLLPYVQEPECVGLRFYPYADAQGHVSLFYTAVNAFGLDIIDAAPGLTGPSHCSAGVSLYSFSMTPPVPHLAARVA